MMADKIQNREWADNDGAKLWVQRGWYQGKAVFSTAPDEEGVEHTVLLTKAQVRELVRFLNYADG